MTPPLSLPAIRAHLKDADGWTKTGRHDTASALAGIYASDVRALLALCDELAGALREMSNASVAERISFETLDRIEENANEALARYDAANADAETS